MMSRVSRTGNVDTMLNDLFTDHTFTDVTIVCDDKVMIPAHKNILTSASTLMKELLEKEERCNTVVCTDVSVTEIKQLLQFIYLGEVSIKKSNLKSFIEMANGFGIQHKVFQGHDDMINPKNISPNSDKTKNEKHKKLECDQCDYKTNLKGNLKAHIEVKHDLIRVPCSLCDFWGSRQYIYQHMKNTHGRKFSLKKRKNRVRCDLCGKHFSRRDTLEKHLQDNHEGGPDKPESGHERELGQVKQESSTIIQSNIELDSEQVLSTFIQNNIELDSKQEFSAIIQSNIELNSEQETNTIIHNNIELDSEQETDTIIPNNIELNSQQETNTFIHNNIELNSEQETDTIIHNNIELNSQQETDTIIHNNIKLESEEDAGSFINNNIELDSERESSTIIPNNIEFDSQQTVTFSKSNIKSIEPTQFLSVDCITENNDYDLDSSNDSGKSPSKNSSKVLIGELFLKRISKKERNNCDLCDMKFKSKVLRNTHK